jgi:hydroxymethylpyrimidine kinase / phosphomethylpyrimidine kinase / thiamine-phosphate diphosphorylase
MHSRYSRTFVRSSLILFLIGPCLSLAMGPQSSQDPSRRHPTRPKPRKTPIVYTIAGSDSGGGAGIQADLHAIHAFSCHGCTAITCLTAQNSVAVTSVHAPPADFLREQLAALVADLPPAAIKIGMLGSTELVRTVGSFLQQQQQSPVERQQQRAPAVVLDPVMISTSGHRLITQEAQHAMVAHLFDRVDVITPNKYEAEALLSGRKLESVSDVEQAACDLIQMGARAVLIKGGHTLLSGGDGSSSNQITSASYAQDYFLSSPKYSQASSKEARLCDGERGVWIRSTRYDTQHTHGTGCTLSSCMASAMAVGLLARSERGMPGLSPVGARTAMDWVDATCLAKAYVTAGISRGVSLGQGPGPVVHTSFPSSYQTFPHIVTDPSNADPPPFRRMRAAGSRSSRPEKSDATPVLGRILPIVDSAEWVERFCGIPGVTDVQLRIKGDFDQDQIFDLVRRCQDCCEAAGVRLWINDYWEAAVRAKCFGVHVGQEDLFKCHQAGGLGVLRGSNIALGVSTHSYGELAAALGVRPSYVSLGPVFATGSKTVQFDPQGLETVSKWRQLIPPDTPLVAIGGIGDAETAGQVRSAGADCVAVIGAVTHANNPAHAVKQLNDAMLSSATAS